MRTDDSFGNGIRPLSHVEITFFCWVEGGAPAGGGRWRALAGAVRYRGSHSLGDGVWAGAAVPETPHPSTSRKKKKKKTNSLFFFFFVCVRREGKQKKKNSSSFHSAGTGRTWNVTQVLPRCYPDVTRAVLVLFFFLAIVFVSRGLDPSVALFPNYIAFTCTSTFTSTFT